MPRHGSAWVTTWLRWRTSGLLLVHDKGSVGHEKTSLNDGRDPPGYSRLPAQLGTGRIGLRHELAGQRSAPVCPHDRIRSVAVGPRWVRRDVHWDAVSRQCALTRVGLDYDEGPSDHDRCPADSRCPFGHNSTPSDHGRDQLGHGRSPVCPGTGRIGLRHGSFGSRSTPCWFYDEDTFGPD